MEKNTPHCPLTTVKEMIKAGRVRLTTTARNDAAVLGFDRQSISTEILHLERKDFYKSMTTYVDSSIWQDVYRHSSSVGMLYIKLTVMDDVLVVSFKEL